MNGVNSIFWIEMQFKKLQRHKETLHGNTQTNGT